MSRKAIFRVKNMTSLESTVLRLEALLFNNKICVIFARQIGILMNKIELVCREILVIYTERQR